MDNNKDFLQINLINKKFPWLGYLFQQLHASNFNDLKLVDYCNGYLYDHEKMFLLSQDKLKNYMSNNSDYHEQITKLTFYLRLRFDPFYPYVVHEIKGLGRITIIGKELTGNNCNVFLRKLCKVEYHDLSFVDSYNMQAVFDKNFCNFNWIIAGASGTGKTTLLIKMLIKYFSQSSVVFIDKHQEGHSHENKLWTFLKAQPMQVTGTGSVSTDNLLELAFKLAAKVLVIGEVSNSEIPVLFNCLFSGHHHFYATMHAKNFDFLSHRLEMYYPQAKYLAKKHIAAIFLDKINQEFHIKDIYLPETKTN